MTDLIKNQPAMYINNMDKKIYQNLINKFNFLMIDVIIHMNFT